MILRSFAVLVLLVLAMASPGWAETITETFTHGDQSNNLDADYDWTTWMGSGLGIVSNQAKLTDVAGAFTRLERVATTAGGLIYSQVKLVQMTKSSGFAQGGPILGKDSGATNTYYGWYARKEGADAFFLFKIVAGVYSQIGSNVLQTINANDVLKLTWNPATGALEGFVNGVSKITATDTAITTSPSYIGIAADSSGASNVIILDDATTDVVSVGGKTGGQLLMGVGR